MGLQELNKSVNFPSLFDIGDSVEITIPTQPSVRGWIRAVIFTNAKVRYSVFIKVNKQDADQYTTLHNIDSVFISKGNHPKMDTTEVDNYS